MKYIKYLIISIAISGLVSLSSCTNLDENVYDKLTDESIDVNDPAIVGYMMGEVYAQFRFLYWGWNGYFDLMEECSDNYDAKADRHRMGRPVHQNDKHSWNSSQGILNLFGTMPMSASVYWPIKTLDVLQKQCTQAQMRFMRALNYYVLLDAFRIYRSKQTRNVRQAFAQQSRPKPYLIFV